MKDHWSELARRARLTRKLTTADEPVPLGFTDSVMNRLARAGRESSVEAWAPLLRPALGLAFATAFLCVLLQVKAQDSTPDNLLVETENLIRLAVLK
ncbi:MAG TPA: hypothetical protein VM735_05235 [Candidatus Kapabacteria bacterium]|nr:hypothetical protein [Candidatus Kapabacteria bacterium]